MRPDHDKSYWDRHAKNYDRSMAILGRPFGRMLELVGDAVRGRERILEVAAGTGLVTVVLGREAREVVATDYAPEMVTALERRVRDAHLQNVGCQQADLYALPFEPEGFDAVVAANVLHLVPNLPEALAALRRVLKPNGLLVAPTFCHDQSTVSWLISRALTVTGFPGQRRFTATSLRAALQANQLQVSHQEIISGPIPICYIEGAFPVQPALSQA